MAHTVTGLVDKPVDAQRIIEELTTRCLSDRSDISIVSGSHAGTPQGAGGEILRAAGELATATGHAAVALISGAAGLAQSMSRQVPGFGMLAAAGRLGAELSRTAVNTGEDFIKALVNTGIRPQMARDYADALRQGRILIVVNAKTDQMAQCARQVMATQGATMPEAHASH